MQGVGLFAVKAQVFPYCRWREASTTQRVTSTKDNSCSCVCSAYFLHEASFRDHASYVWSSIVDEILSWSVYGHRVLTCALRGDLERRESDTGALVAWRLFFREWLEWCRARSRVPHAANMYSISTTTRSAVLAHRTCQTVLLSRMECALSRTTCRGTCVRVFHNDTMHTTAALRRLLVPVDLWTVETLWRCVPRCRHFCSSSRSKCHVKHAWSTVGNELRLVRLDCCFTRPVQRVYGEDARGFSWVRTCFDVTWPQQTCFLFLLPREMRVRCDLFDMTWLNSSVFSQVRTCHDIVGASSLCTHRFHIWAKIRSDQPTWHLFPLSAIAVDKKIVQTCTKNSVWQRVDGVDDLRLAICTVDSSRRFFVTARGKRDTADVGPPSQQSRRHRCVRITTSVPLLVPALRPQANPTVSCVTWLRLVCCLLDLQCFHLALSVILRSIGLCEEICGEETPDARGHRCMSVLSFKKWALSCATCRGTLSECSQQHDATTAALRRQLEPVDVGTLWRCVPRCRHLCSSGWINRSCESMHGRPWVKELRLVWSDCCFPLFVHAVSPQAKHTIWCHETKANMCDFDITLWSVISSQNVRHDANWWKHISLRGMYSTVFMAGRDGLTASTDNVGAHGHSPFSPFEPTPVLSTVRVVFWTSSAFCKISRYGIAWHDVQRQTQDESLSPSCTGVFENWLHRMMWSARAFFVPSSGTEPHHVTLQTLNLGSNEVGADDASALAAILQAAFVLSTLCLCVSHTVDSEIAISMLQSKGSDLRIVACRYDSDAAPEYSSRTGSDLRVLQHQHFIGDDCLVILTTK